MTPWRNGSASDSRSEGCVFKSRRGQIRYLILNVKHFFKKCLRIWKLCYKQKFAIFRLSVLLVFNINIIFFVFIVLYLGSRYCHKIYCLKILPAQAPKVNANIFPIFPFRLIIWKIVYMRNYVSKYVTF